MPKPSARIVELVEALPLRRGMRVLELGCGPGVAARLVAERIGAKNVLGIDRSKTAIAQARKSAPELTFRVAAIEDFTLAADERPYDLAFALRVGALDGRHPELEAKALARITAALTKKGRLFIDGGDPLRELKLNR
ncbi:MAG: class I SAM-dependent methyltransferase [Myxococcaceae bacterium]|nr:class I SAM-dependent methyltransferase [Myxococcaceae bacterium]